MAKYAENVNQRTKIIDVQKQFPGGLKTVDTDDALGKVYLREVDNLSLSEYSFLEKRHGQYIEHQIVFEEDPLFFSDPPFIQGYFEYVKEDNNIDCLLFVEGRAYVKRHNENFYKEITEFSTEDDDSLTYPDPQIFTNVTDTLLLDIVEEASVIGTGEVTYTFRYFENYQTSENVFGTANASASFVAVETPIVSVNSNANSSLSFTFIQFENPIISETTNIQTAATAEFIQGVSA